MEDSVKRLTRANFGLEDFKKEKSEMTNFRKNCFGENMDNLWSNLQEMYIPNSNPSLIQNTYTLSETGEAIPDRMFLAEDSSEVLSFKQPIVGIKVHTALSLTTARTPDVKWDSDSSLYEKYVPVLDSLRKSDWYDTQTRQQYVMMWFYDIMFGTTFWRRFYSKIERKVEVPTDVDPITGDVLYETQNVVELDQTVGEAFAPYDVLIDPNTRPLKPRSMKKVIYTRYFTLDDFRAEFKGRVPAKKLNEVKADYMAEDVARNPNTKGRQQQPSVRVDYYESEYIDMLAIVANDKVLLSKDPLPYRHKKLSIMMAIWMPRNSKNPYGLGPIEMMREDKLALDEFVSMTMTQTKFSIYKAMFYQGSLEIEGQDAGEIRIRPDRAYKVSNTKDLVFPAAPGPGADSWRAIEKLRANVDDASGINKPLGGEIANTTAYQTDLAKDAALARLSVPIDNIVSLLVIDAERTLELQRQYYGLPHVKEIVDPDQMIQALQNIKYFEDNNLPIPFRIWAEQFDGESDPRVLIEKKRTAQLGLSLSGAGEFVPSEGKNMVILTSDVFAWKGRIHVVKDSLLSITPTIERGKRMEMFNIVAPMLGQPPEIIGKIAREIIGSFGEDYRKYLPENFLQYFEQLNSGQIARPEAAQQAAMAQQPPVEGAPAGPAGAPLTFEPLGAPKAITSIQAPNPSIASASQVINQTK